MKKIILFVFSLIPLFTQAQLNYIIQGSFKGVNGYHTPCVYYKLDDKPVIDTGIITGNKFIIKGTVPRVVQATVYIRPERARFTGGPNRMDQIDVYLENGTITINTPDSLKNAIIGGTSLNKDYRELVKLLAPFKIEEEALEIAKRRAQDFPEYMPAVKAAYAEMDSRKNPAQEAFIDNHLNSLVGLELLANSIDPAFELPKAQRYFNKFPKTLQESVTGKTYANLFHTALGCQAPDFTAKNLKGEDVSLSSYKGKYVLLDFWASWCMPCRADNPHVRKLYDQYKDQNFTVLGFSVDNGEIGKKYWLKAINMDGVTWDQVSELKGFQSIAAKLYGITAVPTNFLIDPSGKIIGKNLRRADLDNKLAEILTKSKSK